MTVELLPYFALLLAIFTGFRWDERASLLLLGAAILAGLGLQRLTPIAVPVIVVVGLSLWLPARMRWPGPLRWLGYAAFLMLALAMSNHLVPGFHNLPIYQDVTFAADSIPFTMYLNFDKTVVGLFIFLFFLKAKGRPELNFGHLAATGIVLACLVLAMMPLALAVGYVRFDVKWPEFGWIWMLNNLFFVCLAEEGLFRGFIQGGLARLLPKTKLWSVAPVVFAATLFGLAHYKGGLAYVLLAGFAGLFYGYVYHKTKRIECAMLVHFGLNLTHFLFFSYPALAR